MANPKHVEIVKQGIRGFREWRKENPDIILDLRKADLEDLTLTYTNFKNCELVGASFNTSSLWACNFEGIDLSGCDFCSADLRLANLKNANLTNADVSKVNFHETNFSGTNLTGCNSGMTSWDNLDLSQAIGLESIQHWGPSTIGIDTLNISNGKIPLNFLRGCGLSDEFIQQIPKLFLSPEYYSCFISYSHADNLFARRLHDALQGRGIRCWLDEHQILPGDNIYERIDHGIRVWDKVLLCASKHSLTSGWVNDELKHAFAKEKQLFKDRGREVLSLIPLNLDGYLFSDWNHPNKNQMLERMAPDFTGWESDNTKFEQQLERVVKALQTKDTGREPEPKPKL